MLYCIIEKDENKIIKWGMFDDSGSGKIKDYFLHSIRKEALNNFYIVDQNMNESSFTEFFKLEK